MTGVLLCSLLYASMFVTSHRSLHYANRHTLECHSLVNAHTIQFNAIKITTLRQVIHFSNWMAIKIFNAVNTGAELGLATPLTTAASVSFFLTRIEFISILCVCVCVCVIAWVYMHPHMHRSKAFMFASTTCSWTLVVSLTFILPHSLSMAGHFWQVWLCAILYKIKAFKSKLPD